MNKISSGKLAAALTGVAALGLIIAGLAGVFNGGFQDGGIDVNNTACEDIGAARQAVNAELESRRTAAQETLTTELEANSDAFWAENRRLEDAHHACMSGALTADPCKPAFEKVGMLYDQIMAQFDAGGGFNEDLFNQREQAKKEYNDCVEKARNDEFYEADKAQCDADLAAGQKTNEETRIAADAASQAKYEAAVATAQSAHQQKHAILDAIEEKCNEPGGTTSLSVGGLTTGGTGTDIHSGSSACTGVFVGNDPEAEAELRNLENQLQKARAAGLHGGLYGIDHLQGAVNEARQRLTESERTCETDADCGDPTPVCCSGTEIGRVFCDDGVCANERVACDDGEICAGSPAMCVSPATGAQQGDGVYISRSIPEVGACSQKLQVLDLQPASADSVRYEIVGNIPSWVNIDKPGGSLPAAVDISYSCNTVQGFGPGTYTASGSILVKNAAGELINTIPLTIFITVTPVAVEEEIEVIQYGSYYIPLNQVHSGSGSECDGVEHWHANGPTVTATDGTVLSDPNPTGCGFGKTSEVPVMTIPWEKETDDSNGGNPRIEIKGLEGLKTY